MKFNKNVPWENREVLAAQLKRYEKEVDMTNNERKELHKWVAAGHSPYANGDYICNENGWPMDFVNAMRFEKEQLEWFQNLTEEEKQELISGTTDYDTELEEPELIASNLYDIDIAPDTELPFQ